MPGVELLIIRALETGPCKPKRLQIVAERRLNNLVGDMRRVRDVFRSEAFATECHETFAAQHGVTSCRTGNATTTAVGLRRPR